MGPDQWRRVNAVLQDALARPPAERAAFLEQASTISSEDRREIESLLRLHDEDSGFLESGVGELAADLMGPDGSPFVEGYRIGSYTIVRELGRGGMGVVYLGLDRRLDRPVAIKLLTPGHAEDTVGRERLRREARAAAAVSHPGIAHVYALEEDDQGTQYIVSEYVEGHTLRAEIERGPLPPPLVVATALEIARAVAVAHARHIVHRDLKPENVMRTPEGHVKVLDFGLARSAALAMEDTVVRLTASGTVIGTPGYMAPEQWRGDATDASTDIFSLGLVIYEMAVGAHAFATDGRPPTIVRLLDGTPNPIPPEVGAALPGLDAIVQRCLQKDPAARYASMQDLISDLEALDRTATLSRAAVRPALAPSGSQPQPQAASEPGPLWWWQVHQAVISGLYIGMIYPVWLVRHASLSGPTHSALVLVLVVVAAVSATFRLHLVFTARVHPGSLAAARRRARAGIRALDWSMALLLLGAAGIAFASTQLWLSAVLATVSACCTVAFLLIEPATADAAFPQDE